jgi:glutamate synthase domain-containing protein 1
MSYRIPKGKDISGCAISGIMSEKGTCFSGDAIIRSIAVMHERSNGLGGGFAAYGIYPNHADRYTLHLMCDAAEGKQAAEQFISRRCIIYMDESIPTRPLESIRWRPVLHRYFVNIKPDILQREYDKTEDDLIVELVMEINSKKMDAYIFSSGKNMGVFKGVGYPEDIGNFYQLEKYDAYIWIAHGRFPTNTTGWWGGAHPFGLLDWAVVHNGEISSYGINRRYLANFDYHCNLRTDTEVIAYIFDLLLRKHGLPLDVACTAMAPPFWSQIERMPEEKKQLVRALRIVYGGALLNGPFGVVVAHSRGMIGFNDRIKLRPNVAARKEDMLYLASEEAAIREVCRDPDVLWHAEGGVPVVGELRDGAGRETKSGATAQVAD